MNDNLVANAKIEINSQPSEVWRALTTPELVKKYFFGTEVVSDWKVGSPIIYKGEWEGKPYEDPGVIVNIKENKLLEFDHRSGKDPDVPEGYHRVKFEITPDGEATTVAIAQNNNKTEEEKNHSEQNWMMVLSGLKKLLES